MEVQIPSSFQSRRSTFKGKLECEVGAVYQFFQPLNREVNFRQMLLIPMLKAKKLVADEHLSDDVDLKLPAYENNDLRTLMHAALKIRGELTATPGHSGLDVSKEAAMKVVPDSLHLFLSILMQGADSLDSGAETRVDEHCDVEDNEASAVRVVSSNVTLSIAQDIVFAVSKGKKQTPKHLGLGLTLYKSTHSRNLLNLFNAAGHCCSYWHALQASNALAHLGLRGFDAKTGAVIPVNFQERKDPGLDSILHITADNLDITTDSLSGKKSFHVTQMAAFQRNVAESSHLLKNVKLSKQRVFQFPPELSALAEVPIISKPEPDLLVPVNLEWFRATNPLEFSAMPQTVLESKTADIAFAVSKSVTGRKIGWTEFQRQNVRTSPARSAVGYMPIILNPAHELSSLCTVLHRSIAIADGLGKRHVVITTDQALYCKLLELQWSSDIFKERVILKMGGLHIAMNFLQVIGTHMAGSGLSEIWLESGFMGEISIRRAMEGKAYSKAMRGHKLTSQALWRLIFPQLLDFLDEQSFGDGQELLFNADDPMGLKSYLQQPSILSHITDFLMERCEKDKNFALWWSYLHMVSILLMFTRGIRGGDWNSYLHSLSEMIPYMAWHNHSNYLKSMAVHIATMHSLPEAVERLFLKGDFGVLLSDTSFAQVDPDHAQEWLIKHSKDADGGLLGTTSDERTHYRWSLSLPWQGEIANQTYAMFDLSSTSYNKEETEGRRLTDAADEDALFNMMETLELLAFEESDVVSNIATKDKGTQKITDSLLSAQKRGSEQVQQFISQRLLKNPETNKTEVSYYATVPKNKALTLKDLHTEKPDVTATVVKRTNRDFLHSVIAAYDAGRQVDLHRILKHEMCDVPVSIATMNGDLKLGDKASFLKELLRTILCPPSLNLKTTDSVLLIDGMAFIRSLGRPANARTFGDLAVAFNERVRRWGRKYFQVHILFDRYRLLSIKGSTRKKRSKGFAPVRRQIKNADVPLPANLANFMAMPANKADLARFLSQEALNFDFGFEVILSGGFENETEVRSTFRSDVSHLSCNHEEADTRIVLHAVHVQAANVIVSARDTDVILLLVRHFEKLKAKFCWVMGGTAKARKYIPINDVHKLVTPEKSVNIMGFHAATGSDTTSKLASVTKTAAFKIFLENFKLFDGLGTMPLAEDVSKNVQKFLLLCYKGCADAESADHARVLLFGLVRQMELMPPTRDALILHINRCHYQVCVWENAHLPQPVLPDPRECGWKVVGGRYVPILMTLPAVPSASPDLVACKCKGICSTRACGCQKQGVPCIKLCKCSKECVNFIEKDI